jgi:hypothetical protein
MTELRKVTQLAWRKIMLTEEGKEAMLFLREKAPSIIKSDADQMIFDAGRVEGYKQALDNLSNIIASEPKKELPIDNE